MISNTDLLIYSKHLPVAVESARRSRQRFVLDHLPKPAIRTRDLRPREVQWSASGKQTMRLVRTWQWARIACCACVLRAFSAILFAQIPPACKGPAELEKLIATQPSAGVYDALGAYFGQRQQLSCALAACEGAVHQDPNSWEARFNLSLALLQKHDPARAAWELRVATRIKPDDPLGHIALGQALSELGQNEAAIEEFKFALKSDPKSLPALGGLAKALIAQKRYSAAIAYLKDAPPILRFKMTSRWLT